MKQVDEGLFIIDREHDLVHSQDDEDREGKGWYIQKSFPKPIWSKTSQLFATKQEAVEALKRGKLKFD